MALLASQTPRARPPRSAYVAWATICVVWGTTYLAIKIALESIPPFMIGAIRFVVAGTLLIAWLRWRGTTLPRLRETSPFVVLGFLMMLLGNGGVVWAEQFVPSGLAAVILATSPFWMVGVDALFAGGARLTFRQVVGLCIGFIGIIVLVGPDVRTDGAFSWSFLWGVVALQVACAGWSVGSSYGKRLPGAASPLVAAGFQMLYGGLWMAVAAGLHGEFAQPAAYSSRSIVALLYLIFVGGLGGFASYIYALSHLPMALVSLYAYVNPIIAVLLGTAFLGEPFSLRMVAAIALILIGVSIVPRRG